MILNFQLKFACIIPCFNELERIEEIFDEINKTNSKFVDWYILDNGSLDESYKLMKKKINEKSYSNIYICKKNYNNGLGSGIKFVIKEIILQKAIIQNTISNVKNAKGINYKAIGWTHADGQTPIKDILKAVNIMDCINQDYFLVKGLRVKRKDGFISTFFTSILNLITLTFFSNKIISPNSQPTFVSPKVLENIISKTNDNSLFDLSVTILCSNLRCYIERFPVIFLKRRSGSGANESLKQKVNFSIENLKYIWKMKSHSKFKL